ncbi:MAG TPA: ABC transporter ATP-binding protein [Actinomycetota bacterium]|nr:ABC transporter ATP-binding protein [Actinomycetota bacterium]
MTAAIETTGLSKRYGRTWALRDCTLAVPSGRVAAVVGPNGAGKTTLMRLAVGLRRPTRGSVSVFGRTPRDDPASLARVGFVAQETPLYRDLTVADHLEMGRRLNGLAWDRPSAAERLGKLSIPLDRRAAELSGGQRAQVALTIALAKRPDLLVLDEPVASLDPLARRTFLSELMGEVAARELTVLLSSHLIADLEHRCDYLVILSDSRVQVLGDVDDLLATHSVLVGAADGATPTGEVVSSRETDRQRTLVVRSDTDAPAPPGWVGEPISLEDLVLAYLSEPDAGVLPGPEGPA